MFKKTGVMITSEGRRLLRATVGTSTFTEQYVKAKISALEQEIDTLAEFAKSQPHAASVHSLTASLASGSTSCAQFPAWTIFSSLLRKGSRSDSCPQ